VEPSDADRTAESVTAEPVTADSLRGRQPSATGIESVGRRASKSA